MRGVDNVSRKGVTVIDISGMDLPEISNKLQPYITDYFVCCEILDLSKGMFAESYMFDFEEIQHLVPIEYHSLFKDTQKFNGASGILNFAYQAKRFRGSEYTVMLLSNEDCTKALFLYLQENNLSTDAQNDILVMDFLKQD